MKYLLKPSIVSTLSFLAVLATTGISAANDLIVVPPGNTRHDIPDISGATDRRHVNDPNYRRDKLAFFAKRFNEVAHKIRTKYETKDFSFKEEVRRAADLYQIDPIHIAGAIVGEHALNVDIFDKIQEYTIRMERWKNYFGKEHPFAEVTKCPELRVCNEAGTDYDRWTCYRLRWQSNMRGRIACGGKQFPNKNLVNAYFEPTLAGKTYGFGQMGPITVLSFSDVVSRTSGRDFPQFTIHEVDKVYEATLDPRKSIHYMAASIRKSIDVYAEMTGFDISQNPGITATLYNLGMVEEKAKERNRINAERTRQGQELAYPDVNYYGWFVNYKENEIRGLLQ